MNNRRSIGGQVASARPPTISAPAHEHEFEAARGLPEALPEGERLLWQGAPDWRLLARDAFHVGHLTAYFAAILAARLAFQAYEGASLVEAMRGTLLLAPLAAIAIGMALLTAWLVGRTTVYTLTNQRLVLRIGIVLSLTFNLPLRCIDAATLRCIDAATLRRPTGAKTAARTGGDIVLALDDTAQIAYVHLWPHARPWHLRRTQPMLRALPDVAATAALLAQAWSACRQVALAPVVDEVAASIPQARAPRARAQQAQPAFSGAAATGR